jgi:hypothetical protein
LPLRTAFAVAPHPLLLQNLVDADVVDKSDVFGSVGDDNDDFLQALINAGLPGEDLNLGVWKLLAVAMSPSLACPCYSGTSSKQQGDIA